jgi:hypothetical protein
LPNALVLVLIAATGCATPSAGEKEAKPADLERLKTVGGKANGTIVWTSARAGTPHLFTMKTDGSQVKQLTKGDMTDWYPRFSPNGSKILFCRSQEEGFVRQGQANAEGAWDLYTINVDGTEIGKVVENASWGSWIGPDEILFQRGGKILRAKLGTEDETKVVDTSHYPIFAGAIVQQPELSHDGHFLAMTLAGTRRQVGLWNVKKKTWTEVGQGSQIGWAPDGATVLWRNAGGRAFAEIAQVAIENGKPPEAVEPEKLSLLDLPGKRSREAFPRLSNDGKWLVLGAGIKNLEDDLEDFELYLWEVGAPKETATRLTFHGANDSWPDLFIGEPGKVPPPPGEAKPGEATPGEAKPGEATPGEATPGETSKTEKTQKVEKADTEVKEEPAQKAEPPQKEEPAGAGVDTGAEESDQPMPTSTAKPKGKGNKGKKKRR